MPYKICQDLDDRINEKSCMLMGCDRILRYFRLSVLMHIIQGIIQQRLMSLASEMAYNNALAMFPALAAILTLVSTVTILRKGIGSVAEEWFVLVPTEVVTLLKTFVDQITLPHGGRILSISFVVTIWVASSAISVAMTAIDQIYRIPPQQIRPFWKKKLISLALTIGLISFLLIASFLILVSDLIVQIILAYQMIPGSPFLLELWNLLRWTLAPILLALGFGILYRFGPSLWQRQIPLWPGAIIGALLWTLVSKGLRVYVTYFGSRLNLTYGTLTAGILLLLWLNLSSLSMLIGAQVNFTIGQFRQRSKFLLGHRF